MLFLWSQSLKPKIILEKNKFKFKKKSLSVTFNLCIRILQNSLSEYNFSGDDYRSQKYILKYL